ncbi:MAG: hypothetical protein ACFFDN_13355, partial [Candidatus Hodarchaeota archaeon]
MVDGIKSLKYLLQIEDDNYPWNIDVKFLETDKNLFKKIFNMAKKNGLDYLFIEKIKKYKGFILDDNILDDNNARLYEYKKILTILNEISEKYRINYIVIKACDTIAHIPRDVDIFVKKSDRINMVKKLKNYGMKCMQSSVTETSLKLNHLKVDIYTELCYLGYEFIDENYLWDSKIETELFKIKYPGLRTNASFLITLVHSLFGHRNITLLDYLHIKNLINDIQNIEICRKYAYKKGWGCIFDMYSRYLKVLDVKIYKEGNNVIFPFLFDKNFILMCLSSIRGFQMNNYRKISLYITFMQDEIIFKYKDTLLYDVIKKLELLRYIFNFLTAYTKK